MTIRCPVCGKEVQTDEDLCPGCGLRFDAINKSALLVKDTRSTEKPAERDALSASGVWLRRHRWSSALAVLLGGAAVVLLASGVLLAMHDQTGAQIVKPTPTPTPGLATPTLVPGFVYYTDPVSGFQAQYPTSWQSIPQNPGVEFDDSQTPTYILQILLPTDGLDVTRDWVAYEMGVLRQSYGTGNFQQAPGTITASIGGALWTGGAATIKQGQINFAVKVLTTVHDGHVFVINMYAANVSMADAESRYFDTILNSFIFLG